MIEANKKHGRLHLILELIDRGDLREEINEKYSIEEQEKLFEMLKDIIADEIRFVINVFDSDAAH